jgi:hypothetical protein
MQRRGRSAYGVYVPRRPDFTTREVIAAMGEVDETIDEPAEAKSEELPACDPPTEETSSDAPGD